MQSSKKKYRMEPKEYIQILDQIEFKEIFLESCSAEIKREKFEKPKSIKLGINDKASYEELNEEHLKIIHKYYLTGKSSETKDVVFKIRASFCLIFQIETKINDDFFEVFRELSLPLNSWPYFREFTQNVTQRMNIPPLTLPFIRRS